MTARARPGLRSLRARGVFPFLLRALGRASRRGFRVVHFSVQSDHLHLLVEADDRMTLIRGAQGLMIRTARAVNRALGRRGSVWADRYHGRALRTPREVRLSLAYVLLNFRKHLRAAPAVDPMSSGPWFEGWRRRPRPPPDLDAPPVVRPSTWLLDAGWRRAGGPVGFEEAPRSA